MVLAPTVKTSDTTAGIFHADWVFCDHYLIRLDMNQIAALVPHDIISTLSAFRNNFQC